MLKVVETFNSIQGEGPNAGHPAYFIRLAGCNLKCPWCDTQPVFAKKKPRIYHQGLLLTDHVVITGGEPALQTEGITQLIRSKKAQYIYWELETNGTIANADFYKQFDCINISPKLSSAGYGFDWYEQRGLIKFWREYFALEENPILKFVIGDEKDLVEAVKFVKEIGVEKEKVYLMPLSSTRETFIERSKEVAEMCIKHGFRFSPRLQLLIWDRTVGV